MALVDGVVREMVVHVEMLRFAKEQCHHEHDSFDDHRCNHHPHYCRQLKCCRGEEICILLSQIPQIAYKYSFQISLLSHQRFRGRPGVNGTVDPLIGLLFGTVGSSDIVDLCCSLGGGGGGGVGEPDEAAYGPCAGAP